MSVVLQTRGLTKRYGDVTALDGVDLEIREGEIVGFLGANGAGKTTFTRCVTGLVHPSAGQVSICGIDALGDRKQASKYLGLVPDEYEFYGNRTGRQHLWFYGRLQGLAGHQLERRIERVLDVVSMVDRADMKVSRFSHGMKQRICLAQAILHEPRFLLLDEPTNGLDPRGIHDLQRLMRHFADQGMAIFLSSHILSDVEKVCDRVAIVSKGRLRLVDTVKNLQAQVRQSDARIRLLRQDERIRAEVAQRAGHAHWDDDWLIFPADTQEIPAFVRGISSMGGQIVEVRPASRDLASVFLELTEEVD